MSRGLVAFGAIPHDFWFCCLPKALVKTRETQEFFDKCKAGARLRRANTEKKKRTRPPPKENLLGNFSGLKENFPGRWWIQKPYGNPVKPYLSPKSCLYGPIFFRQREVLHWSRVVYAFFFPATRKPRHASDFSTHSDMQAVPALPLHTNA